MVTTNITIRNVVVVVVDVLIVVIVDVVVVVVFPSVLSSEGNDRGNG